MTKSDGWQIWLHRTKDAQLSTRGRATENTATWKTMWLLCGNVVYLTSRRCHARLWWRLIMLWTYTRAAGRDVRVAREYFCEEEMISPDDLRPLPNMWWNATGMKRHSWGNTAGHIKTMVEVWKLQFSCSLNLSPFTLINVRDWHFFGFDLHWFSKIGLTFQV